MSIGQGAVAGLCCWEGNRRSDVAPAMRHRLCGISTYGFSVVMKGDEHSAYTPVRSMAPTFTNFRASDTLKISRAIFDK